MLVRFLTRAAVLDLFTMTPKCLEQCLKGICSILVELYQTLINSMTEITTGLHRSIWEMACTEQVKTDFVKELMSPLNKQSEETKGTMGSSEITAAK